MKKVFCKSKKEIRKKSFWENTKILREKTFSGKGGKNFREKSFRENSGKKVFGKIS